MRGKYASDCNSLHGVELEGDGRMPLRCCFGRETVGTGF